MSYTYGFFDAVDLGSGNYDRVYSSAEFSHYWALLVGDGVFGQPSTSLNVLATTPVAMSVKVSPGTGWIKGHYLTVPDNMDEVIAVPVANPSLPRIDSIIMALDNTDRMMKLYVRSGTAAASPTAVALQRDADIWELELAQITVAAGAGNITQQAIKDMRTDPDRCGIVTGLIDQFDISGFLTAAQASFDEWFEDIQSQLGDDVAGNLLNLINEMKNPDSPGSLQSQILENKESITSLQTITSQQTDELNRQAYDLYTLWLKDYYLNGANWSPQALGAKAILFDGFVNSSYIKTMTGKVQNQQLLFPNPQDAMGIILDGTSFTLGTLQGSSGNPSIDGTKVTWTGGGEGSYLTAGIRVVAPEGYTIAKAVITGKSGSYSRTQFRAYYTSTNGTNFTLKSSGSNFLDKGTNGSWTQTITPNARGFEYDVASANQSGSGNFEAWMSVSIIYNKVPSWSFESISFNLPQSFRKAKLFLSASSFSQLSITPKLGSLVCDSSEISSRVDPMFPGFTEKEFNLEVDTEQPNFSLKIVSNAGITSSIKVKRYGVYFIG